MDILKDKAYNSYTRISRYTKFPYYYNTEDNKYVYGTTTRLIKDIPYSVHVVTKWDTPDTLALQYYNNPTYYWVILDFNDIQDPFAKLNVGSSIKIPTFSMINFEE